MQVKFLIDLNVRDEIHINKDVVLDAYEDGDFIMIEIPDGRTVKAPKSEIEGILEIID